uniref:Uncharacterized protein n=1 Tax=Anguilla anguilla TaxID=7936 RepID=A0A0E9UTC0_ANGAN
MMYSHDWCVHLMQYVLRIRNDYQRKQLK